MATTAFITSGQETHQAVVPGLLRLPQEVLEMITLQLHPREVILLSLVLSTMVPFRRRTLTSGFAPGGLANLDSRVGVRNG